MSTKMKKTAGLRPKSAPIWCLGFWAEFELITELPLGSKQANFQLPGAQKGSRLSQKALNSRDNLFLSKIN